MKSHSLPAITLLIATLMISLPLTAGAQAAAPKPVPASKDAGKDRAAKCNAQAGEKKLSGDARKKFLANCLK